MLLSHFNLRDQPFGVTPDPRYFFPIKTHREALAGLLYGIDSGLGFIALTAQPGMGKTTLLRIVLDRLGNTATTVFLYQMITDPAELFRALLIDLGETNPPGTLIELEMRLKNVLLKHSESGRRLVIVLDEAQSLDDSVLEAMRTLSNFETSEHKLIQVVLCGQQQLADRLATQGLAQLRQRISIFATLKPLTRSETAGYIEHRLNVAGYQSSTPLFTPEAVSLIAHYADGIPRNINNICFNSLSFACAQGKKVIDTKIVREAIAGLRLEEPRFAAPIDDHGVEGATFAEPIVEPGVQGTTFDQSPADASTQRSTFAEPSDELSWRGARFAEPIGDSEPYEYESEEPDSSEQRESSPILRIALIAAVLCATVLGIVGWNLSRPGGPLFPLRSQITSWLSNSPPMKNQLQVQAPAVPQTSPSPQVDESAQTSIPRQDESAAPAATPSQGDSSIEPAVPSETKPAKDATVQPPPVQVPKSNHERAEAKPRASRNTIPNSGVQVIGARQGQSFAGICVERFNGCTTALLKQIEELNPDVKDHDHLRAGQQIVVPSTGSLPKR